MICRIFVLTLIISLIIPHQVIALDHTVWWTIDISVSVTGTYKAFEGKEALYGHYSFRGVWLGAMERDNGDYILYQGSDRILFMKWIEEMNQKKHDQSDDIHPKLKLNYVLRRDGKIHFDFEIFSFQVTLEKSQKKYNLILPRSAENDSINQGIHYNKGVVSGSNRIELLENRIYKESSIQEKFEWNWSKKQGKMSSNHSVGVVLRIKKIGKENS